MAVKFRGWGRLNFNSQLLPMKYSDFVFNLLKACIDNVYYVNVSSVGVFFSNLFRFKDSLYGKLSFFTHFSKFVVFIRVK